MRELQAGKVEAFNELMRRWEVPLQAFLLRLGVPSAQVEDVAQEAFVRLYEKRHLFRANGRFKAWMLTLGGNLGRNAIRWRFRHPEAPASSENPAPLETQTPFDKLAEKEKYRLVRTVLEGLPVSLRQVLACVDAEEMSYAETAQILGLSPKAVESRLLRARRKMRSLWEQMG